MTSRNELLNAIDSPTVEALAQIFDPRRQRVDKSYSEQIVEILEPQLKRHAQTRLDPKGEMTKIAAECHRAKWRFDLSGDFQPSKTAARALILQAFHELHRIGDMAIKARDAYSLSSTPGQAIEKTDGGAS